MSAAAASLTPALPLLSAARARRLQLAEITAHLPGSASPMAEAVLDFLVAQGHPLELRQLVDAWPQPPVAENAQAGELETAGGGVTKAANHLLTFRDAVGMLAALGWEMECLSGERSPHVSGADFLGKEWLLTAPHWETATGFDARSDGQLHRFGRPELVGRTPRHAVRLRLRLPEAARSAEALEQYVQRSIGLQWFAGTLQPLRPVLWQLCALSALITLCALAAPLYVMLCYQQVIHPQRLESLPWLLAGAGIWLGGEACSLRARRRLLAWASARTHHRISLSAVERLLSLPAAATERAGVMSQLLRQKSLEAARDALCSPPFQLAMDAPFVLLLLGVMIAVGGSLALVPLGLAAIYAALIFFLRTPLLAASHRHARALSERQQLVMESLHHLPQWRGLGLTERWMARFAAAARQASRAGLQAQRLESLLESISAALLQLAVLVTLLLGIQRVWAGEMGSGALMGCMMLCWRILTPLQQLCTLAPQIIQMRHSIAQLNRLMATQPESALTAPARPRPEWSGTIRFHQVLMRYDRQPDAVFAGLSFHLAPGEILCVTGGNGVGKSSVLKLAMGLYRPLAGSVRLDGADIRQFDARTLRTAIAYLPQKPQSVSGTVRDLVCLLAPLARDPQIVQALDRAGLADWMTNLPDGLASRLDASQLEALPSLLRHQLHLARLYLSPARVLLIDELPNSLLDAPAGEQFRLWLLEQRGQRTIILASQREDYLRLSDQICWLRADGYPKVGRLAPAASPAPVPGPAGARLADGVPAAPFLTSPTLALH